MKLNKFVLIGLAAILVILVAVVVLYGNAKKETIIETDKGTIVFEMFPKDAPKTVANFEKLANKGFYNGLTFHRVEDWVIQGGDPTGTGTGGSDETVPAEFNSHPHVRGTVGMARTQDPNSATSQFYITKKPAPYLDGQYTVFGQVTKGMDVLDKIKIGDKMKKVTVKTKLW